MRVLLLKKNEVKFIHRRQTRHLKTAVLGPSTLRCLAANSKAKSERKRWETPPTKWKSCLWGQTLSQKHKLANVDESSVVEKSKLKIIHKRQTRQSGRQKVDFRASNTWPQPCGNTCRPLYSLAPDLQRKTQVCRWVESSFLDGPSSWDPWPQLKVVCRTDVFIL